MKLFCSLAIICLIFSAPVHAVTPAIKNDIESTALDYFLKEVHPISGLVLDKAQNFGPIDPSNRVASIASTGFGFAVIAHAVKLGKIDHQFAVQYIRKTLRFSKQNIRRYKGWFLHFIDWETGKRVWDSEYSTIDTALFIAGALYADQILKDPEIHQITNELYRDIDFWDMMTDGGTAPAKRTLTLSYTKEHGYVPYQWEIYSEQIILLVLGLGHPTRPLPKETWDTWKRMKMGSDMPLFIHQYSLLFLDLRKLNDGYANYFKAGVDTTVLHRNYLDNGGFWGLSAGDSSTGYRVFTSLDSNGTFCLGCAAGSLMFKPQDIYADVQSWKLGRYGKKVWGKYGLVDSINLQENWFSTMVIGITKGPEYLSSVNTNEQTSVWKDFMTIPAIKTALKKN